ncbi:uncharacterized protein F5Z01DRAFT_635502 [Emericellopsis atlantica]|uniref:Septin-type G domain-containing protein n=1 Tax=Emericellopsis atlantica TaxID=2614577 RepID=A0A9P7ZN78_9HYPO|nr:uncharacterized protein F5Z01DRAFT_635502 [Emericellopsis atlantica]KAG9255214.1 hypothetical protein F5Z01DRAFT_635502 [Emericellopsis atlantica]
MRPTPGMANRREGGGDSEEEALLATPTANLACFITTEAALDAAEDDSGPSPFQSTYTRRKASFESPTHASRSRWPSPTPTGDSIASLSSSALDTEYEGITTQDQSPMVAASALAAMSEAPSIISDVSSRRQSVEELPRPVLDEESSFAPSPTAFSGHHRAPQLIMPSLSVPQRRPFSEAGRSVGKLKLLVAGQPGIGKTSLVQAIAHSCEHIVHMNPVASAADDTFSEIWASTRPRPWWQADPSSLAPSRKRRRSSATASEVLDRNICFVVKSAFHKSHSHMAEAEYADAHVAPLLEKTISDSDMSTLLSTGGESNVDAVLYLIAHTGLEVRDIECITSLQQKTNVIPLLARADELDDDAISAAKNLICQQIQEQGLDCFSFCSPENAMDNIPIFAVSSATRVDHSMMDASVLMSSGYIQPLVPTDLEALVQNIFTAEGCAWLRHSTAAKCVRWRRERMQNAGLRMALTHRDPSRCAISPVLTVNPFARRYWDRVEVSNWAQGLRHSLEAERHHRAVAQQLLEDISKRSVRPRNNMVARPKDKVARQRARDPAELVHQDPLGLLDFVSQARKSWRTTTELLSALCVLGCGVACVIGPRWWSGHRTAPIPMAGDALGWSWVEAYGWRIGLV